MSSTSIMIVLVIAVILSIVIGYFGKINVGSVGYAMAFLVGICILGVKSRDIVNLFPTNIFLTQFLACFFYGFGIKNGSFSVLADRLVYMTKGKAKLMPFALFAIAYIIALLGAGGEATPAVMSPIAFTIASSVGFAPILAAFIVWAASVVTIGAKWTPGGATMNSTFAEHLRTEVADEASIKTLIILTVGMIIVFTVYYFITGSYKNLSDIKVEEPKPATKEQKQTLAVIFIALLLVLIPNMVQTFFPNPLTKWMSSNISILMCYAVGIVVLALMKVASMRDIIKTSIPWNSLITITGMATLVGLMKSTGAINELGAMIGDTIPPTFLSAALVLVCGLMSYVVGASSVIYPMFAPMIASLSASSGISPVALIIACVVGGSSSSFSPISTGGSMAILGASDDVRDQIMGTQFKIAIIVMVAYVLVAVTGILNLFG